MTDEKPWWWRRCTHSTTTGSSWMVLREAEQLVILMYPGDNLVHILVDVAGVGSVCKQLTPRAYGRLEEPQLLDIIRSMRDELRSL